MNLLAHPKTRNAIAILLVVAVLAVSGFFWNEARKEIFYLCGNFAPGTTATSVHRQLATGSFLQARTTELPTGSRIVVDSWYNLRMSACSIEVDADGYVTSATFDQAGQR